MQKVFSDLHNKEGDSEKNNLPEVIQLVFGRTVQLPDSSMLSIAQGIQTQTSSGRNKQFREAGIFIYNRAIYQW